MSSISFTIHGTFPSLNEFIAANRSRRGNWSKGNQMKQEDQEIIVLYLRKERVGFQSRLHPPVFIRYHFFEKNLRRDLDNISGYFHKVFQDALVAAGILEDDSPKFITGMSDSFSVDRKNPRIEIEIEEAR